MSEILNSMYKDMVKEINVLCTICKSNSSEDCFILPCTHVFHINCIVNTYINNIYENSLVDYIQNIKCFTCQTQIDIASIFYISGKYSNILKNMIETNTQSISIYENCLSELNEKLKTIKTNNEKINNRINIYTNLINNLLSN